MIEDQVPELEAMGLTKEDIEYFDAMYHKACEECGGTVSWKSIMYLCKQVQKATEDHAARVLYLRVNEEDITTEEQVADIMKGIRG